MFPLPVLALLLAIQSAPSPQPLPTPSTAAPAPTTAPTPAPSPFAYVIDPSPMPSGSPQIVEVSINDRTLHAGGMLLVKVTTSLDVTVLFARTMGHQIGIPLISPGIFAGQTQLPLAIPSMFLNRTYSVDFVGTTADGRTAIVTLPIRLEH
jgi:hypothetical protein